MDIVYRLQGVEFEWDEDKARSNIEMLNQTNSQVIFDLR